MALISLQDILAAARKLPLRAQAQLAETLLRESSAPLPEPSQLSPLEILRGMSEPELRALAEAILAPGHQRRLGALLAKNKRGKLTEKEEGELDRLLEESDRIALLKAKATLTLRLSNRAGSATA